MLNPLRRPIVLIGLLAAMAGFVHLSHQRQESEPDDVVESDERINLRMPTDRPRTSILRMRKPRDPGKRRSHKSRSASPLPQASNLDSPAAPLPQLASPQDPDSSTETRTAPSAVLRGEESEPRFIRVPRKGEPDSRPTPGKASAPETRTPDAGTAQSPGPQVPRRPNQIVRGPKPTSAYARHDPSAGQQSGRLQHRIVDGDTLRSLANRYLGDERRYMEIFQANRHLLVQPDLLPLGEKLTIPIDDNHVSGDP